MRTTTIATGLVLFSVCVAFSAGATRPKIPFGQFTAFEFENFGNPRYGQRKKGGL